MFGRIFLFIGFILIGTGVIVTQSNARVKINNRFASEEQGNKVKNYIGGGLAGLGLIFSIAGVAGIVSTSKKNKRGKHIMQNGIDAQGTITFVDKNWKLLVNHKPIYSIVEYTYLDSNGQSHSRRISNLNSDLVIRKQLQVGGTIPIKYLAENPGESVIIL
ncbi:MAG: hypothetical protein PHW83_03980 [Bacteroidales bacterium]|nr:hypothetical protein [Bacteroidales bacterium]